MLGVEDGMPATRTKTYDGSITQVGGYYNPEHRAGGPVDFDCWVGTSLACKSAFHDNESYGLKVELALWDLEQSASRQSLQLARSREPSRPGREWQSPSPIALLLLLLLLSARRSPVCSLPKTSATTALLVPLLRTSPSS